MQNVQLPVWAAMLVALGVALVGAAGPVAAQVVNAWRERKREEVRWQREKAATTIQLQQAHKTQWRETRIQCYGKLINALELAVVNLNTFGLYGNFPGKVEHFHHKHVNIFNTAMSLRSEASLMCSEKTRATLFGSQWFLAFQVIENQFQTLTHSLDAAKDVVIDVDNPYFSALLDCQRRMQDYLPILLDAIRDELGVTEPLLD